MALPPVLNKIIEWLRAGYPEGVPDVDYVPLFALLGSQLTNNEVNLPFYESHGFRTVRESETPKGGPRAWAMVKSP